MCMPVSVRPHRQGLHHPPAVWHSQPDSLLPNSLRPLHLAPHQCLRRAPPTAPHQLHISLDAVSWAPATLVLIA